MTDQAPLQKKELLLIKADYLARYGMEMYLTDPERQKQHHTNQATLKLKELIDHNLSEVRTLQELKEKLRQQNYQTYLGRGIAFVNTKNG